MNISPREEIAGFPAVEIRDFFRKFSIGSLNVSGAAFYLGISVQKAKKIKNASRIIDGEKYLSVQELKNL